MGGIEIKIKRKLKDQRPDDDDHLIPIPNPQKDDIVIPYVFLRL
jgi:hypothetical protein